MSFQKLADWSARRMGTPIAFVLAVLLVIVWALAGPVFHFSDTWQLVINTSTTVLTFLMVFLIQATQNRDNAATQAKLDELILKTEAARNVVAGIDRRSESEIEEVRDA